VKEEEILVDNGAPDGRRVVTGTVVDPAQYQTAETFTIVYELDGDLYLRSSWGWVQSTGLHYDADGGEWVEPVAALIREELDMVVTGEWMEHADYSCTATVVELEVAW